MYGRLVTQDQLVAFAASSAGQGVVANEFVVSTLQAKAKFQANAAATQQLKPFREPQSAPLRKLSVDLIKTYKHINEVSDLWPCLEHVLPL